MSTDLLILGSTSAAWAAALTAARRQRSVALVTPPHEPQLELRGISARLVDELCQEWRLEQVPPRRREALRSSSWNAFRQELLALAECERQSRERQFAEWGGQRWHGNPSFIAPLEVSIQLAAGETRQLTAEAILLATGTTPVWPPPSSGSGTGRSRMAASLLTAEELPTRNVVVGASTTGLRAACLLAQWGAQVEIVDGRQPDSAIDDLWLGRARELGVDFRWGQDAIGIMSRGRSTGVILEGGETVRTEQVWWATSRRAVTDALRLDNAGLSTDDHGRLWCSADLQTWTPGIWAAGDLVGFPGEWAHREETLAGELAARQALAAVGQRSSELQVVAGA